MGDSAPAGKRTTWWSTRSPRVLAGVGLTGDEMTFRIEVVVDAAVDGGELL